MSISDERLAEIAKECAGADGVSVGGWRFKSDYVSFADMEAITAELIELRAAAKVRAIREGDGEVETAARKFPEPLFAFRDVVENGDGTANLVLTNATQEGK